MDDLEGAREQALAANSYVAARAYLNLASMTVTLGDLRRGRELHRQGLELAKRFGSFNLRWLECECVMDDYNAGLWDEALARVRDLLDESGGERHYMDAWLHAVLSLTALARGEHDSALVESEQQLAMAQDIGDPQALWPALGIHARVSLESSRPAAAQATLDELVHRLGTEKLVEVDLTLLDAFVAAAVLGRGADLAALMSKANLRTPWVEAGKLIGHGEFAQAADLLTERDAVTYAAYTRLLAAERSGDHRDLGDAIAFFQRVGATAYLTRAEALLQATA
jgi:ATP/maltotriose-dependent transcriptional regulator MalT